MGSGLRSTEYTSGELKVSSAELKRPVTMDYP